MLFLSISNDLTLFLISDSTGRVLVTIPGAGPPCLIEFHSIDNDIFQTWTKSEADCPARSGCTDCAVIPVETYNNVQ